MTEKPLKIIRRFNPEPHMEIHYSDHIEFWTYDNHKLRDSSKVEAYP